MSSKPLISTAVDSGTSHVNVHKETGLVVPPGNSRALREAMDDLNQNPEKARQFGVNARNRYEQLFTGSLMGQRYTEAYQRVLESSA